MKCFYLIIKIVYTIIKICVHKHTEYGAGYLK